MAEKDKWPCSIYRKMLAVTQFCASITLHLQSNSIKISTGSAGF